jgi:hypothetical protein
VTGEDPELSGLPLAARLVEIAAAEALLAAPAEAAELLRVGKRLEAHIEGRAHVHDEGGRQVTWLVVERVKEA